MKNITPLRFFFSSFVIYLVVAYFIHYQDYNSGVYTWKQLFEEFGKDINMALFFTFVYIINLRRKDPSEQEFKRKRNRLIAFFCVLSWVSILLITILEKTISGDGINWTKLLLGGIVLTILQLGLMSLFSGFWKRKPKPSSIED